jgi:molybdopterin converting factor subunit 1
VTVRALLFGHYRDLVDGGEATLSLPDRATIADAAAALATREPRLSDLLARTRVAVGAEFATPETILADGDELAFLPPMSGG